MTSPWSAMTAPRPRRSSPVARRPERGRTAHRLQKTRTAMTSIAPHSSPREPDPVPAFLLPSPRAQDRAARLGKRLRWAGYALVALVVPVLLATRGSHLPGEVFVVQVASLAIAVAGLWLRRRYPEHTHWDEPSDKTRPSVMEPLLLAGLAPLTVAIFRDLIEARLLVMGALTLGLAAWALVLWRVPEVRRRPRAARASSPRSSSAASAGGRARWWR